MTTQPRLVEVRQKVLKQNDLLARSLRQRFRAAGVRVVSLVSSPGAGKTTLLEKLLTRLREEERRVAALVGDLATENDAARLARSLAPVRQITTGTVCHLEAAMVESALDGWRLEELDVLFIENVGNLVCPAGFDLGEAHKVAILSVTEGDDKPLKYPDAFAAASAMVLSKIDLLPHLDFDVERCIAHAHAINPDLAVLQVSARSGEGMTRWVEWLIEASGMAARAERTAHCHA